ncbi:MAG: hypothetical protein WAR79_05685 [Melioribacteraceae bacterium]
MNSFKQIKILVRKEENYVPISSQEKSRIRKIILDEIEELVNRFDGSVRIKLNIYAKGNA